MNESLFLADKDVKNFIAWVKPKLDTGSLKHQYVNRRTGEFWTCDSLFSAYKNYRWTFKCTMPNESRKSGTTFEESAEVLSILSGGLRHAIKENDPEETFSHCRSILDWGGVLAGNGKWISDNCEKLPSLLSFAQQILRPSTANLANLDGIKRMNSGFSKIYSLLVDDLIIYDGRVGAAIGLLVRGFCQKTNRTVVPNILLFAYGPPYEGPCPKWPKLRNPSVGSLAFPSFCSNPADYTKYNIRASWLLKALINQITSRFRECPNPLHALEAALFMIGYDLSSQTEPPVVNVHPHTDFSGYLLETRGGKGTRKAFKYWYNPNTKQIVIKNVEGRLDKFRSNELWDIVSSLKKQFGTEWFPLANNVEKLPKGTEKPGLGTTILSIKPGDRWHAQAASYLGVVFEDLGLCEWNGISKGIEWRLLDLDISLEEIEHRLQASIEA